MPHNAGVKTLLLPDELDRVLRYPPGKSERLARRGKLPHLKLPDGSIRFDSEDIGELLNASTEAERQAVASG